MELTQSKWNYHSTSIITNILSQINKQRYRKSAYSNSYCDYQQDKVFSSTICYRLAGNNCSIIYDRSKKCWSCERNVKQSTCVCHHNSLNAFYLRKTETCKLLNYFNIATKARSDLVFSPHSKYCFHSS